MKVKRSLILIISLLIIGICSSFSSLAADEPTDSQYVTKIIYLADASENDGFEVIMNTQGYIEEQEQLKLEAEKWEARESEYPSTTYVFRTLTETYGMSAEVACGIIGNMMVEVGGWTGNIATMNLDVFNSGKTYYGVCQWKKSHYKAVVGRDLEGQVEFLMETIQAEMDEFSKRGYTYESFLNIDNPSDAALAFAKQYERCGKSSYSRRQRCAEVAYKYFTE